MKNPFVNRKILATVCLLFTVLISSVSYAFEDNVNSLEELEAAKRSSAFIDQFTPRLTRTAKETAANANSRYFHRCQVIDINWAAMSAEQPTTYFRFPVNDEKSIYARNISLSKTNSRNLWKGLILSESGGSVFLHFDLDSQTIEGTISSYTENSWEFRKIGSDTLICQEDTSQPIDNGAISKEKKKCRNSKFIKSS